MQAARRCDPRLQPVTGDLIARIDANEDFEKVATEIASRVSVTPGQVTLYVQALIAHANDSKAA